MTKDAGAPSDGRPPLADLLALLLIGGLFGSGVHGDLADALRRHMPSGARPGRGGKPSRLDRLEERMDDVEDKLKGVFEVIKALAVK